MNSWADDIEEEESIQLVRTEATPRPVQKNDSEADSEAASEGEVSLDSTGASWADLAEENDKNTKQFESSNTKYDPTKDDGFTVVINKKKQKSKNDNGIKIKCIHCNVKFFFPNSKAEFFKEKGYSLPKRCKKCIETRKKLGPLPRLQKKKTLNIEN